MDGDLKVKYLLKITYHDHVSRTFQSQAQSSFFLILYQSLIFIHSFLQSLVYVETFGCTDQAGLELLGLGYSLAPESHVLRVMLDLLYHTWLYFLFCSSVRMLSPFLRHTQIKKEQHQNRKTPLAISCVALCLHILLNRCVCCCASSPFFD